MSVEKYKPKATPRMLDKRVGNTIANAQERVADCKKSIQRTRELIEESRLTIKDANTVMGKSKSKKASA